MDAVTIKFKANGQQLTRVGSDNFAANTVSYIRSEFELGDNWDGFDSIRAVWATDFAKVATVLDGSGACVVPWEVLNRTGTLYVNLVGSISDGDELTDRLTTYKAKALDVNGCTNIEGTETAPLTPSQFEQFVAIVEQLVGSVKDIDRCVLNADYTLTIYYTDGTSDTVGPIRGEQGATGPAGNGISSIAKIGSTSTNPVIDTYRITYTNGTHTDFTVTNGLKGDTGATGNGIESVYLTATHGAVKTYTILFTDGTTYDFNVTDGEVTLAELASVLPTDTASGAIASFPDGSDLFDYLSCIVDIDPVQDLHGYDKPWVGGAGKNKLAVSVTPYSNFGVTVSQNGDKVHIVANNASGYPFTPIGSIPTTLPSGTYYIKKTSTITGVTVRVVDRNVTPAVVIGESAITLSEGRNEYAVEVAIDGINLADGTYDFGVGLMTEDTAYEPYSNICPITGWTGCSVVKRGINLWDEQWESGYIRPSTGEAVADASKIRMKNYVPVLPNTTYYKKTPVGFWCVYFDANKNYIGYGDSGANTTFTTPPNCYFIRSGFESSYGTTYNHDISINYPSTDHDYHAYTGNAIFPITWQTEAGTVYGGTVDVVSGVLTVDMATVDLGTLDWLRSTRGCFYVALTNSAERNNQTSNKYANIKCEIYPTCTNKQGYDCSVDKAISIAFWNGEPMLSVTDSSYGADANAFKTAMNGVQAVYEISTPTTYQLTPTQVACLLGQNNVWADCGDVDEVKYKADVQLYIEKMLNS